MSTAQIWPDALFEIRSCPPRLSLVRPDGATHQMQPARWHAFASGADLDVLGRVQNPVLDVGCGPGRHVAELTAAGHPCLGIDTSPAAVATARARGAEVLHQSIFAPVPGTGTWGTVLLLDGNIGIGGDPVVLLARCADLLRPGGTVLVESEGPGAPLRTGPARLTFPVGSVPSGESDDWFPWATVGTDGMAGIAPAAGLALGGTWSVDGRWFAELRAAGPGGHGQGRPRC